MGSCFGEGTFVGVYNFICLSYKWTVANRKCQLTMPYQRYKNVICFVLIFSVCFVLRTTRARGALWSLFLYFSHEVLSSYATREKKNTIVGWFNGSFSVFYVISPVICRDKSDARWELFFFLFALFPFVNRLPFHLSDPIIVFLSFYIGGSAKLKDIWYSKMVEKPKIR